MRARVIAVLLLGLSAALPVAADEATDAAKKAVDAYKVGDLLEAATQWEYAAQLARQQRSEGLLKLLPKALPGWTEENAQSSAVGAAMLGGSTNASKDFNKDNSSVTVNLSADNPMLAMFSMMATNPAMASQSGSKPITIEGQRGVLQYDSDDRSGELTVVAHGKYLIQVSGSDVDADTLMAYAKGIDYAALAKL